MSKSNFTRRGVLKTGAVAGAGLATPTLFTGNVWAEAHSGFTNAPTGDTVTLGFNVPQTGPYADEGADELRASTPVERGAVCTCSDSSRVRAASRSACSFASLAHLRRATRSARSRSA